jgi:hypothetical protein
MVSGQCLCGDVKYKIEGKISPIWLCHCSKCRRSTGSAFHASAICPAENFTWQCGEEGIREYESTPTYLIRFCGRCGTPVPQQLRGTELVFLHVGALDDVGERRVDHHIFTGSKASWFEITDDKPQFDEHKPAPE